VANSIRLLYTEDNPTDSDLTREHFATSAPDIQLEIVETGAACLARLASQEYDVLLLDNHLPDMDALDVLKVLAERDVRIPVIVATAVGDEELVVRLLRVGAWDYVPKHGHYIETLPSVVRRAVADYRRLRDVGHAIRRGPRRILYVERHPADIDLTTRHLAEHAPHFQVEPVASCAEALERLQQTTYDLVLTDLRMADMSAIEMLREARHRGVTVPFVVVTGKGDETAAIVALTLGASDYIVKRDEYLTQLPYALDNAIDRFQLMQAYEQLARANAQLQAELGDRERAQEEHLRMAEHLQRVQKIDSLGRLAGGLAHDFNNLLTVISGNADLMLQQIDRNDPLWESANEIQAAGARAGDLTRQLLAFGRRQLLRPRVLDLNVAIRESSRMLRRLVTETVELALVLDPALAPMKADPGQLDQVLINLAVNARDAMPHGGRLTIETKNVAIGEADAERHPAFQAGDYVLLAVSDTGVGIDKDTLPLIFEPFFTTKEQGKGTGLGLSMVYGIVKQSGGWIWVYSEPGHGTTFKVYLPRANAPVRPSEAPAEIDLPHGEETILVVEDEEQVRRLTSQILRRHGYIVLEAANGHAAIERCDQHDDPITLLITDVVMPGMSGPHLAATLVARDPDMKVLFTSGYADAAVVEHGLADRSVAFLQKPFTQSDLTRKVRDVLDGHPS
jgi:signal transduction histidine kinase